MIPRTTALLVLAAASAAAAQGTDLARRVSAAPDGQVRFTYAARPGVYGNGRNTISWDCSNGRCRNQQSNSDWDGGDVAPCDSGPVRLAMSVRDHAVTGIRVYVGGNWRPAAAGVTDLGTVSTREATRFLLDLAAKGDSRAGHDAIFPTTLADSVTVWPDLLRIARDRTVREDTRKSAVFWLGQAAGAAATKGLSDMVDDTSLDLEVKKSAVFAISQLPHDDGVPALINVARSNRSPAIRKSALFWLGQTNDPRAIALFEEILTRP
jgi:HEAT repeat protein